MFSGIQIPLSIKMGPAFQLHRHKCIDLQRLHTNDRIDRTVMPKVDVLYKQWCVLPALNASAIISPVLTLNYQAR